MKQWTLLVSAGVGPVEVRRFVALLGHELAQRCEAGGLLLRSVTAHGDEQAPRSVELEVRGDADAVLEGCLGSHVLVARSGARGRRSRKRWFAGVSLHRLEPRSVAVVLDPTELQVTAARAGGPGGQHVNTTSSAVRVRHLPTGICVRVATERSQHQNRRQALQRLAELLAIRQQHKQAEGARGLRRCHYCLERGSAVQQWVLDDRTSMLRPV